MAIKPYRFPIPSLQAPSPVLPGQSSSLGIGMGVPPPRPGITGNQPPPLPGQGASGSPRPQAPLGFSNIPKDYIPASQNKAYGQAEPEQLKVTQFMTNVYGSMQNIDPDQRAGYLQNQSMKIKERLDRYEFRMARGLPLTPEQQQQYNSMKQSYNDIQNYINDPQKYEQFFESVYNSTAGQHIPEYSDVEKYQQDWLNNWRKSQRRLTPG